MEVRTETIYVYCCSQCDFEGEAYSAGVAESAAGDHIMEFDDKEGSLVNLHHEVKITQTTNVLHKGW